MYIPDVSLRTSMYDSRSGMESSSLSLAWIFTASKNNARVSLKRAWGPGLASLIARNQKLGRNEIAWARGHRIKNGKKKKLTLLPVFLDLARRVVENNPHLMLVCSTLAATMRSWQHRPGQMYPASSFHRWYCPYQTEKNSVKKEKVRRGEKDSGRLWWKRNCKDLQMKKIIHKIRNDSEPFRCRCVVTISRKLAGLQSLESFAMLVIQDKAVGIQPTNGLRSNFITVWMIYEWKFTMAN